MIKSIEIENLRGIRSCKFEDMAPLTILTGPNGSGKSTLLDALLIATKPHVVKALGQAVQRHSTVAGGARWLFGDRFRPAILKVRTEERTWTRELQLDKYLDEDLKDELQAQEHLEARPPFLSVSLGEDKYADESLGARVLFDMENAFIGRAWGLGGLSTLPFVHLVQPGHPIPLHRTFAEVVRSQRRKMVYELLRDLIDDFEQLEILVEDDDEPVLHLNAAGRSIPVGLAGDGIRGFVQLALETAIAPKGLVLLEEPEVYQHPKAIWQTARVLHANRRRGVQIVVSTHSLELIDALIAEAEE